MHIIRENTTIAQLVQIIREKTKNNQQKSLPIEKIEKQIQELRQLIAEEILLEPHRTGQLLGSILRDLLETADRLGLDPAGCLSLTETSKV